MKTPLVLALVAATLSSAVALAADAPPPTSPSQQAAMDRMTRAMTPGPRQALLTAMAGEWTRTVKLQMSPAQPAQEFPGTATISVLLDGRYVQEVVSSHMGETPYNGMGLYGFDNVSGKYVATLIDNMGTGFMSCLGAADTTGKVIRWEASVNDPASGKPVTMRMVTTVLDDDHHTLETFAVSADGKRERKLMTVDYVRKP